MVGVTAKYSADVDRDAQEWRDDRRHVLFSWWSTPFHGHGHRHEHVEQRVVIQYHHGVGVDIRHEARSDDTDKFADDWQLVQEVEVRDYGARHDRRPEARWLA